MPTGLRFVFGPFAIEPARHRLIRSGEPVAISNRQLDVLLLLVARAGQIVSKDDLLQAGWQDVAVGDNSLEQAISSLRRQLGAHPSGVPYIETVPRRGYRFGVAVTREAPRESDAGLDALLAPHRAFIEGRAALETLEREQIARAREVFESALSAVPEHASAHVGLATACVMQFEMTRVDSAPDAPALARAAHHAREACRLDPQSGEAWATLGFVLDRTGNRSTRVRLEARRDAGAATTGGITSVCRTCSWGEERLRAAQRTLALLPDFPLARWLAATVHVARQVFDEAERELTAALASQAGQAPGRFAVQLGGRALAARPHSPGARRRGACARGVRARAVARKRRSPLRARVRRKHLVRHRRAPAAAGPTGGRRAAFERALERAPVHAMAHVGLAAAGSSERRAVPPLADGLRAGQPGPQSLSVEAAMVRAAQLVVAGAHADAARLVGEALAAAPPGNAGWLLPVEPLLHVAAQPDIWARALALLRNRAA